MDAAGFTGLVETPHRFGRQLRPEGEFEKLSARFFLVTIPRLEEEDVGPLK